MTKIRFFSLAVTALFIGLMINSCKKENNNPNNPYNGKTTAIFNSNLTYGSMTDQDGNIYKTITIGEQTWMAENLRTTKYRDGSDIPNVTDNTEWTTLTTGAYCNYNNTESEDTIATYGRLYNWYAFTDSRNISPTGWHVPTEAEWNTLKTQLGGFNVAGGKMKETGTTHWTSPNTGATNESGFTALPSGFRCYFDTSPTGMFVNMSYYIYYWSSTPIDPNQELLPCLFYNDETVGLSGFYKNYGFAVRLVKD